MSKQSREIKFITDLDVHQTIRFSNDQIYVKGA